MSDLLDRLRRGYGAPFRRSEVSSVLGIPYNYVTKLIREGNLRTVRPPGMVERRVPVRDAAELARLLGAMPPDDEPAPVKLR